MIGRRRFQTFGYRDNLAVLTGVICNVLSRLIGSDATFNFRITAGTNFLGFRRAGPWTGVFCLSLTTLALGIEQTLGA